MKLITDLRKTPSRLQKIDLIRQATYLEKKVLYYAYNPHFRFGIANLTANKVLGEPVPYMFNVLDKIIDGTLSGGNARHAVAEIAYKYGDLVYLICCKDLDCGISVKTINTVFPKLIPVFNVQLAKEVSLTKLRYPTLAQIKYDGVRIIARIKNNKCELFTRNGKLVNSPSISNILLAGIIKDDVILDGELITADGKMIGRTSISGRVNSAIHGGMLLPNDLVFIVFDCMPTESFDNNSYYRPYSFRFSEVVKHVNKIDSEFVKVAVCKEVNSVEEANNYFTQLLEKGYEGLILKTSEHKYTFKRSRSWVKVKAIKSADLHCDAILSGKPGTKYEESIGALKCHGEVEGKQISVNVGSGLSDLERQHNTIYYKDKTIEVKYNCVIRNAEDNGWTLFLPRFVSVRFDK